MLEVKIKSDYYGDTITRTHKVSSLSLIPQTKKELTLPEKS